MLIKLTTALHVNLLFLLSLLLITTNGQAVEIPKLNAWVIDQTKTLTKPQINSISEKLYQHEQDTSNQIVVLIIKTLGREPIERYAANVFNEWQLGQSGKDNGVLIVIAKNDRKLRIQVGHDLREQLTNKTVKEIIKNDIAPLINQNEYFQAIDIAVNKLISKATISHTNLKTIIPNWPISLTVICSFFALIIPLSLYYLSAYTFKKQLTLKTCYVIYFIPAVIFAFTLLNFFGSSIKSNIITVIYCLTITITSYINAGILIFIVHYIKNLPNKKAS